MSVDYVQKRLTHLYLPEKYAEIRKIFCVTAGDKLHYITNRLLAMLRIIWCVYVLHMFSRIAENSLPIPTYFFCQVVSRYKSIM